MNEDRKDCKWMELFFNRYNRIEKYVCHLTPEAKMVDEEIDCAGCPHYEKKDVDDDVAQPDEG